MHPAFSVILLTTLIGAGQGLFLALFGVEVAGRFEMIAAVSPRFLAVGSLLSLLLLGSGLAASFFHLGHPERAWRAAAMWRTSWLSREVIVLPAFMGSIALYGAAQYAGFPGTVVIGALALVLCMALFLCTAMIYACLKFLQEWHTPLTLINFCTLGTASGLTLAAAYAGSMAPPLTRPLAIAALAATLLAALTRIATLLRNARLVPKSSLQSATGIKGPHVAQKSQGQMGGSFNTREFFHGRSRLFLRAVKWGFLLFAFLLPIWLIAATLESVQPGLLVTAFLVQFAGLIAERWFFFAQARHPQNLYYQVIS